MKAQRGSRGIVLFVDGSGWSTPPPAAFPPGKGVLLTYVDQMQFLLKSDKLPDTFYE
jgi:hypothetical protein